MPELEGPRLFFGLPYLLLPTLPWVSSGAVVMSLYDDQGKRAAKQISRGNLNTSYWTLMFVILLGVVLFLLLWALVGPIRGRA